MALSLPEVRSVSRGAKALFLAIGGFLVAWLSQRSSFAVGFYIGYLFAIAGVLVGIVSIAQVWLRTLKRHM